MEKIVFSCLWNSLVFWLRQSAMVLKSSRPWSPCSSHYSRAYTAHPVIHEVHTSIKLETFLSKYHERWTELEALQVNSQSEELTGEEWNTTKEHADTTQAALQAYLKEKASLSQSFDYWNTYFWCDPNIQESDQFCVLWRLDSLPQSRLTVVSRAAK